MRITEIVLLDIEGPWTSPGIGDGFRQVTALDIYPELRATTRGPARETLRQVWLELRTDEGIVGRYGPLGEPAGQIPAIRRDLAPLLLGRNPVAIELLHDLMMRQDRHGRSGHFMTAISAVDCALWDLKGKAWDRPVYELLGGPTRPTVDAYASMLGFSTEPDRAAAAARAMREAGFVGQKWFFRHGPGSGEEGFAENIAMAHAVREAVGPAYLLMFDAYMGWDFGYARRMATALEPVSPFWLEEPLAPEHVAGLLKLRQATRVPIATGEHVYGRWQTQALLDQGAVDVLQNDPDWTGGISELVKVCALASARDVPVVPHGHSLLAALHVAASQSPTAVPMVEYLFEHLESMHWFLKPLSRPEGGKLAIPTAPGLGMELDEAKITRRHALES